MIASDPRDILTQRFEQADRTRRGSPRRVALELKFPVVERGTGEAASAEAVQGLWRHLAADGWQALEDSHSGGLVGARRESEGQSDVLASATGYCVVELSTAPEASLEALERRVWAALDLVLAYCRRRDLALLGHGIHPVTAPAPDLLTAKGRNVFWDDCFRPGDPSARVHLFTVTAASQAHVDVSCSEAADAVAVFNGLAPAQIALTANSAVRCGRVDARFKNVHEWFWERWCPDEDRVGMPARKPASLEAWLDGLLRLRPVYVERDGQPIRLSGCDSFAQFCERGRAMGATAQGEPALVEMEEGDLDLHMTFCWHDARLSRYCTLENRVNCQQPPEALMAVGALTLGLAERLEAARAVVDGHSWSDLLAAREQAMRRALGGRVGDRPLSSLCEAMLTIAAEGLRGRGQGEEAYLGPLWDRLRRQQSPADEAIACFRRDGVRGLVERFAVQEPARDETQTASTGGETQ